jgi:tRNA U34 2-thiouridine synthase MnmA/TrmU
LETITRKIAAEISAGRKPAVLANNKHKLAIAREIAKPKKQISKRESGNAHEKKKEQQQQQQESHETLKLQTLTLETLATDLMDKTVWPGRPINLPTTNWLSRDFFVVAFHTGSSFRRL